MANSVLYKLLRAQSQSATKLFSHFQKPSQLILPQIPRFPNPADQIPNSSPSNVDYFKPTPSIASNAYPSFSFEFFLNSISTPSLIRYDSNDDTTTLGDDDSRVIRADSVKKKRKKKMNKHKLGKLRKRLRRKTKA